MGRKRAMVEELPIEAGADDKGFDRPPEFVDDDTPETHEPNDDKFKY